MRQTLLAILLLTATTVSANPTLQGVWKIASTSYDDEVVTPREPSQIKIFTSERVIYTYYYDVSEQQPHYLSVGHGTYSYADGTLRETIVNHSNPDLIGQIFEVTVSVSRGRQLVHSSSRLGQIRAARDLDPRGIEL